MLGSELGGGAGGLTAAHPVRLQHHDIGPGLPQVGPRQEQLRDYFEQTRGSGFDYAYRYPGMNKVLQAAGRVIRTPQDKGVVLLIDDRFLAPETRRLMPAHWEQLRAVDTAQALAAELQHFWKK